MAEVKTVADLVRKQADALAELKAKQEQELNIALELPQDMVAPCISAGSFGMGGMYGDATLSWLDWTLQYASDGSTALDVLRRLEASGWTLADTWRAQYGRYRHGIYAMLPEVHSRETLTQSEPVGPAWIEANTFGRSVCFKAHYRTPSGRVMRVSVDVALPVYCCGEREVTKGTWRYISAGLRYPDAWRKLEGVTVREAVAWLGHSTPCQSMDGRLVFARDSDCTVSPADLLALLIGEA